MTANAIIFAIPSMKKDFEVDSSSAQWLVSSYSLAFSAFLVLGGRASDIIGPLPTLLFGLAAFSLSSLGLALSTEFVTVAILRAFQGFSAAHIIPAAQSQISNQFPDPKAKAKAIGAWAAAGSVGFAFGLGIGVAQLTVFTWSAIFWSSFVVSTSIFLVSSYLLKDSTEIIQQGFDLEHTTEREDQCLSALQARLSRLRGDFWTIVKRWMLTLDVVGSLIFATSISLLSLAFSYASSSGWNSRVVITALSVSIASTITFVLYESRISHPLVPVNLLKTGFSISLISGAIMFAVRQSGFYFLNLQFQAYGNSPTQTALLFAPTAVVSLVVNLSTMWLADALGTRVSLLIGWCFLASGMVMLSFIRHDTSFWTLPLAGLCLYMTGVCILMNILNLIALFYASPIAGVGAGIFAVFLQLGGSILGITTMTLIGLSATRFVKEGAIGKSQEFSQISYQAVYYSCIILCGIGLSLSMFCRNILGRE